ncbi:MAG: quinoprotein dehydrogenase-associated SoxYZ-like carrier [Hyphomicrobium sp.]|nr:quinoprotein dehydrogenase-associated SoxYZ-like carrier [Hyphomicrobium sp.]
MKPFQTLEPLPMMSQNRFAGLLAMFTLLSGGSANAGEAWTDIRKTVFGSAVIAEDDGVISLEVPVRAEDAALVPLSVKLKDDAVGRIRKITLIVDENPSPVAAVLNFDKPSSAGMKRFATRIRVDRYTYVRAIAETDDGSLHMNAKFIKASGGCSAPASKDAEAALQDIGKLRAKASAGNASTVVDIAIRHPNFTGLQIDHVTRAYTPARFIEEIRIVQAGQQIASIESGISISENPNVRLELAPHQSGALQIQANDTSGAKFSTTVSVTGF